MKILAFAASNSRLSINKQLIKHSAKIIKTFKRKTTIDIIDINDFEMPIYNIDHEHQQGIPERAYHLYQKIGEANALLIAFAEHNGHYTAAYKNIFDWMSRINIKVYQQKPSVFLSTSSGGLGGANVLKAAKNAALRHGALLQADLAIPNFHKVFDAKHGKFTQPGIEPVLTSTLAEIFVPQHNQTEIRALS